MDHLEPNQIEQQENPQQILQEPEQIHQESEQSPEPAPLWVQPPVTGFYHGVGAGQKEALYGVPPQQPQQTYTQQPYTQQPYTPPYYTQQPYYQQPVYGYAAQPAPEQKKPSGDKKGLKGVLLMVIAAALIIVSGGGAAVATGLLCSQQVQKQLDQQSNQWQVYLEDQLGLYEEELEQLQNRIEDLETQINGSGGELTPPEDGLTAAQIYEQNVGSVVNITCSVVTTSNGQSVTGTSAGTGFVITEDGYIVTNHHVIENASSITVTFENGKVFDARCIGADSINDVALLKINAQGLQSVKIGSSAQLRVGDQAVAIGNALGELSFSLTVGYVSGMDREIVSGGNIVNMIQVDAAINSGNSGGPLFNARGEVIGITTAKYSGTTANGASIDAIGFAIPIDDVLELLQDLMEYGYIKSASLGIYASDIDRNTGSVLGVYVQSVQSGSCAEEAGIQAEDIIVELGGYEITCLNDLSRALRKLDPGETVSIVVWRDGYDHILTITLDEKVQNA